MDGAAEWWGGLGEGGRRGGDPTLAIDRVDRLIAAIDPARRSPIFFGPGRWSSGACCGLLRLIAACCGMLRVVAGYLLPVGLQGGPCPSRLSPCPRGAAGLLGILRCGAGGSGKGRGSRRPAASPGPAESESMAPLS